MSSRGRGTWRRPSSIDDSELVFVGYGVVAPEFNWDDYKGLDVKGKTLVMLVNDPPVPDPANPSELDAKVFGGKAMTYYGRWTYKFDIASEKGAAGVLLIHETGPAGYPFQVVQDGFTGERFDLVTPDKNMSKVSIEAWMSMEAARKLLQMAGQDFDKLKQQAATRDFKPVPLGITASMTLQNKLRTIDSQNVIGKIEGSDPARKDEYVVYTAHWDHFGKKPEGIFHGAQDDALGAASLIEVARAFTQAAVAAAPLDPLPCRHRRGAGPARLRVLRRDADLSAGQDRRRHQHGQLERLRPDEGFDARRTGRVGSRRLRARRRGRAGPSRARRRRAARRASTTGPIISTSRSRACRRCRRKAASTTSASLPTTGRRCVRSGRPTGITNRRTSSGPTWDLTGAREDLKVYFAVGYRVAQADRFPEWKPGNEFKAKRDAMLKK